MAGINPETLAEIKSRINLAELIEAYGVETRRVGSSIKACCPFHKEKTPSFHINNDQGYYKCFGCGESGDAISFVTKYEGITFVEAVKKLAERAGVVIEERYDPQAKLRNRLYQINSELAAFYRRCLLQIPEAQPARDYLKARALDGDIANTFGIGYAPDRQGVLLAWAKKHNFAPDELVAAGLLAPPRHPGDAYYDRFHGRITFPICDGQGRVIAFSCRLLQERKNTGKYVNSPETDIFKKAHTLYALHLARPHITRSTPRRALVCEGQIDVIRCHACGFDTAVASQGTAFTEDHVQLLKRCADTVDLVFDGDKAGIKAAIRTMGLFLKNGIPVRLVSLPDGEDPDSLLLNKGTEAFTECLSRAEDPAPYLIRRLREQEEHPDAMDAVVRMARSAVALIAECSEPVLSARFIQDAADALGLPADTLRKDYDTLRANAAEAERRRAEFQARQEEKAVSPPTPRTHTRPAYGSQPTQNAIPLPPPPHANGPTLPPVDSDPIYEDGGAPMNGDFIPADAEFLPESTIDPEDSPVPDDSFAPEADRAIQEAYPEDFGEPAPAPSLSDLEASRNLAGALCELLVHHISDTDVMTCLVKHLPPAFVHNPYASKLYDLASQAYLSRQTFLSPPTDDPEFTEYLSRLVAGPDRIAAEGDDMPPVSYARDLVRRYWIREYERRGKLLAPNDKQLLRLTLSRKRLQSLTWEAAEPFMNALEPIPDTAVPAPPNTTSNNLTTDIPPTIPKPDIPPRPPEPDGDIRYPSDAITPGLDIYAPTPDNCDIFDTL